MTTTRKPRRVLGPAGASTTHRKRPVDWEGQEQAVLISWLLGERQRGTAVGQLFDVTYHPPNGGQRSKATGAAMKRQGVKSGVSDLVVMDARGGWFGLYLEFKASAPHTAALAQSQHDWLALAYDRGYCAVLAVGLEEAKQVMREYAELVRTTHHYTARVHLNSGTEWRKG